MPPYKVKLKAQKTLCAGTTAFYFEKPEEFEFEAGQFFNFTLLSPGETDLEGNTRALSIASAPHERNLMVAMRLRTTAFKRTLNSLPLGSELLLQGPFERNLVYITNSDGLWILKHQPEQGMSSATRGCSSEDASNDLASCP
jgi:ferredoxin-NADP reductase